MTKCKSAVKILLSGKFLLFLTLLSVSRTLSHVFLFFIKCYFSNSLTFISLILVFLWLMHPLPVCHLEANLCHGHFFAEHQSLSPADFFPATILSSSPFDTFLSPCHSVPSPSVSAGWNPAKISSASKKRFHLLEEKISSPGKKIHPLTKDFISKKIISQKTNFIF